MREWYCPYCTAYVDPRVVTFREHHQLCGQPVVSVNATPTEPVTGERVTVAQLMRMSEYAMNCFRRGWQDGYHNKPNQPPTDPTAYRAYLAGYWEGQAERDEESH